MKKRRQELAKSDTKEPVDEVEQQRDLQKSAPRAPLAEWTEQQLQPALTVAERVDSPLSTLVSAVCRICCGCCLHLWPLAAVDELWQR
jgi:hypothetical protein